MISITLVGSIFDWTTLKSLEIPLGSPTRWEAVTGSLPGVMEVYLWHLVRLKGFGPWPKHGILCALLNDPNFCWKAKQYQSKHPNSWDKKSKHTHKATCSAWTIQARDVPIRNLRCAKQDTSVYSYLRLATETIFQLLVLRKQQAKQNS